MSRFAPKNQRQFAIHVVEQLRAAGYEAFWAGGCVRDQLLRREPKDYDVATNAAPEEIREVFGRRRTLAVGAAFGVITVLGAKEAGRIEVATFRKDAAYSDGRHPDAVEFTNAEEDARRRDFTINALFYDPMSDLVIDYVGGQRDIAARVIRAVGDADARIAEDKLRMLRAVRFASVFGFSLDADTRAAVTRHAAEITAVSAERIGEELRRMLVDANRARAVALLRETGLLAVIMPELAADMDWRASKQVLSNLQEPSFPLALAALLSPLKTGTRVRAAARRLRLSNDATDRAAWLVAQQGICHRAELMPWHKLQRILVQAGATELIELDAALAQAQNIDDSGIVFCRAKLALAPAEFDPAPLIGGKDLIQHGVPRGEMFSILLDTVRDAQLDGKIHTRDEALTLVDRIVDEKKNLPRIDTDETRIEEM